MGAVNGGSRNRAVSPRIKQPGREEKHYACNVRLFLIRLRVMERDNITLRLGSRGHSPSLGARDAEWP
jgi:hypothetical protein